MVNFEPFTTEDRKQLGLDGRIDRARCRCSCRRFAVIQTELGVRLLCLHCKNTTPIDIYDGTTN